MANGILDFFSGNSGDLTPQQLGLLGMAGQATQNMVPSRMPQPGAAYFLGQAAAGYGQGYALGQKVQAERIQNLTAAFPYNIRAQAFGMPTIPGTPPVPGVGAVPPPSAPPGPPAGATMPGASPTVTSAPMAIAPAGAPQPPMPFPGTAGPPPAASMPPAATRVAGNPGAPGAPPQAAPAAPVDFLRQSTINQAFGIPLTDAQKAILAAGANPYDLGNPAVANLLRDEAIKASGNTPNTVPTRPGMLPSHYDPTLGRVVFDTSAIPALSAGQEAAARAQGAGGLPSKLALEAGKRNIELDTTTVNVPLANGQSQLMTQREALAMANGTFKPSIQPPDPMTIKADERQSVRGSVIPAPPPPAGQGMPGVTVGKPANYDAITLDWTKAKAANQTAEANLMMSARALSALKTGGLTELKAEAANYASSFGSAGEAFANQIMGAKDVAEAQQVIHSNVFATMSYVKSIVQGTGSRMLKAEIEMAQEAVANLKLKPESNFEITTNMLGALKQSDAMIGDWADASTNPSPKTGRVFTDPSLFENMWMDDKRNSQAGFIDQAKKDLPAFKGMYPTPNTAQIKALQMSPDRRSDFDAKFGAGASNKYLTAKP